MFGRANSRCKTAALALLMLTAVTLAVWFGFSPSIEKQKMLDCQNKLLESIEHGDGTLIVDENLLPADMEFYDSRNGGSRDFTDMLDLEMYPGEDESRNSETASAVPAITATTGNLTITGIGVLIIERIGVKLPVTNGVSESQLKVAVGHVPQTANIGAEGNSVIAGHRSYTYGHYFNRLGELEAGDIIRYQPKDGEEMVFEIFEILEVLPDDSACFEQFNGECIITLLTCTPVRVASHRLLVRAKRII